MLKSITKNKKIRYILLISFIILFLYFYSKIVYEYDFFAAYRLRPNFGFCLDYLRVGFDSIYQGNTDCFHGPILYLSLSIFRLIFGKFFVLVTTILLSAISFFLIYLIIKKDTKKTFFILPLILFTFFVYNALEGTNYIFLASLLSMTFLLISFFLLFHSKISHKEIVVGIFFAFTLLTQHSQIFPIFIIIIYYLIQIYKRNKFRVIKNIMNLSLPIILIHVMFELLFPGMFYHTYLFFTSYPYHNVSFLTNVLNLFFYYANLNLINFFFVISIFLSAYIFIKKRDVYSITYIISFLVLSLFLDFAGFRVYNNKFIPIVPFFIMAVVNFKAEIKVNYKKYLFWIMILLLLYPGLRFTLMTYQLTSLQKEVIGGLQFIPSQEEILMDQNRLSLYNIKYDDYDLVYGNNPLIKTENLPEYLFLEKQELVNLSNLEDKWAEDFLTKISPYVYKIINNEYSLVIIKPRGEDILSVVLNLANKIIVNDTGKEIPILNCSISIPTLEERCLTCGNAITLYFKNKSDCDLMKQKIFEYYTEHFDSICKKDVYVARMIVRASLWNNELYMDQICNSENSILLDYYYKRLFPKKIKRTKGEIKECVYQLPDGELDSLGPSCNTTIDCINVAKKTRLPEENIKCVDSFYEYELPIKKGEKMALVSFPCVNKSTWCLDKIKIENMLEPIIECKNNMCGMAHYFVEGGKKRIWGSSYIL